MQDRLHLAAAVPWLIADVASRCTEASLAIGDSQTASVLAETARYHLARLPDAGTIPARLARLASDAVYTSPLLATLTPAEMRVLSELATYRTLAEIAEKLSVSRTTVKTHVASLYSKLNASTRAQAVAALGIRLNCPGTANRVAQGRPPDGRTGRQARRQALSINLRAVNIGQIGR